MVDWIVKCLGWLFLKEGAGVANEAFSRLARRMEGRLTETERRLDACEADRQDLHEQITKLQIKCGDYEREIADLKDEIRELRERTQ
jgi:predicted  nucleic acid-binding Zn-ribbon protein